MPGNREGEEMTSKVEFYEKYCEFCKWDGRNESLCNLCCEENNMFVEREETDAEDSAEQ